MADSFKLENKPGLTRDEARRMWTLCEECAKTVWNSAPPTEAYAKVVTQLLFGTGAQESNYEWRKQTSIPFSSYVGGFSFWQTEAGSVKTSLKLLVKYPKLAENAARFLFGDNIAQVVPVDWQASFVDRPEALLFSMLMEDNDRVGVLFSRLHYLRVGAAVPSTLPEQAAYWKKYYNTELGKGRPEQYIENWNRYYPLSLPIVTDTPVFPAPVVTQPAVVKADALELLEEAAGILAGCFKDLTAARSGR